jgi:ribosomal protein L11 methylase PrmA
MGRALRPGGVAILSGLLTEQAAEVLEACLASGARRVLTYMTVAEWAEWAEEPPSMQSLD